MSYYADHFVIAIVHRRARWLIIDGRRLITVMAAAGAACGRAAVTAWQ
jgi:hypothetical protein